jgi:predicted Zn-dependent protease
MRRILLVALLAASPTLACSPLERGYRAYAPESPASLTASPASPAAEALIARFYGPVGADQASITAALAAAPSHPGLHEIAAYAALVAGDRAAAFDHFLAAASDQGAVSPELYLWEMRVAARTTKERLRAEAALRELRERHPRALVRQLATYDLARELRRLGEYDEAAELVKELRFGNAWQVLGSFDNDQGKGFQTPYPPERGPDLAAVYAGVRVPIRFRAIATDPYDGALPLADVLAPSASVVAYAQTFVVAQRARQVDLRLTTSNAVQVWVGEKQVASDDKIYHDDLDNVVVRVSLQAGANRVLVKSAHEGGAFRLAARVTEIDGSIPADVTFAAVATPAPSSAPGQLVSPMGAIDALKDDGRKRFLQARLWWREGHARRASWYLAPWLAANPDNPVAMLFGAMALLENAEAGKALDLLNRGAERHPEALGFLLERARFHAQRRQWERAEKDLAAVIAKNPDIRDARMELAAAHGARGWIIDRCQDLEGVFERWPDDAAGLAELARCKLDRGYAEEAERLLRGARALSPGDARVLQALVELSERRIDHSAAEGYLRELSLARPGATDVLLEEADLDRRQGKVAEARRALEAAIARSPDAARPYDRLAQLALEAKDTAYAERAWRLALEREPEDATVAQRLAALAPTALPLGDRLAPKADDIDRAVQSAASVKVHAGSHVVVLLDDEVVTVNADGSSKRIVTLVSQAVTTDGRDTMIQARLPASGKVAVLEAYAVRKSGERQDASSITGGLVRFRGLEVGSITVVQYAHFAPAPRFLPNEYVQEWHFQATNAQVESSRWRLVMPPGRDLTVQTHGPVERSTEVVGDRKLWTFAVKGAPPFVSEPNMTPASDELWSASVTTLKSWDGYARWEAALLSEAFTASPELDALASKLTVGAKTPREKLERLWAHVAQEIRYQQEYEDTIAGVKPHSAAMVHERGYGDCKDKAVLMIRLARAVGVELRFALLRTTNVGKVKKELPNQQFNHAIVFAPRQPGLDEAFFIDTTTNGLDIGNTRSDDEGAQSLVLDKDGRWEFVAIPYQSPELELARHEITVDLASPEKVLAKDHVTARGAVAAGMRVALRSGEGAKKFYQGLSDQLFAGTTLASAKADHAQDLLQPVSLSLDVDATNAVKAEDDRFRFEVPFLFPLAHVAALASRQHPLRLWRGVEEVTLDADLGAKQHALHLPADLAVEHACFGFSRKVEVHGSHVLVKARYRNTCPEIAPEDYPAFRAAVQKVVAKGHDAIVFGGGKPEKKK